MKKFGVFACMIFFLVATSMPNVVTVTCSLPPPLAAAVSGLKVPFKAAQSDGSGSGATTQDVAGVGPVSLELTYPAGQSPKVFTKGWVFGARAIVNKGNSNEKDISNQVNWSGSGTFQPSTGSLSHPTFSHEGANTITLSVTVGGKNVTQSYPVQAVSPTNYAKVGDFAQAIVSHGCPNDPSSVKGQIANGSPDVTIDGKPAARVGDVGTTCCDCGSNSFEIASGDSSVLIDGKAAARFGDSTKHDGGTGQIVKQTTESVTLTGGKLTQGHGTCALDSSQWSQAINPMLNQVFSKMSIEVKDDGDLSCDQTVPLSFSENGMTVIGSAKVTMKGQISLGEEEGTFSMYMNLTASGQGQKSFPFDLTYSGKFDTDNYVANTVTFNFTGQQSSEAIVKLIAQIVAAGCGGPTTQVPTTDMICSSYITQAQFSRPALPARPTTY